MIYMSYEKSSQKFMEIFSNLPINTRREIVVVVDGKPISWELASKEIEYKTELSEKILKKLEDLKIL